MDLKNELSNNKAGVGSQSRCERRGASSQSRASFQGQKKNYKKGQQSYTHGMFKKTMSRKLMIFKASSTEPKILIFDLINNIRDEPTRPGQYTLWRFFFFKPMKIYELEISTQYDMSFKIVISDF